MSQRTTASSAERNEASALLLEAALKTLDDDKAEDVLVIDLEGKSAMADAMVIASGRSHRHVGAIAEHLQKAVKEAGAASCRVEGLPNCDWVLIDTGDVIVHVFRPEVRTFYNLERMWSPEALAEPANG